MIESSAPTWATIEVKKTTTKISDVSNVNLKFFVFNICDTEELETLSPAK
jgi:hypothetical protein